MSRRIAASNVRGRVSNLMPNGHYGFLERFSGEKPDIYFACNDLQNAALDDVVLFDLAEFEHGKLRAINIRRDESSENIAPAKPKLGGLAGLGTMGGKPGGSTKIIFRHQFSTINQ